MMVPENIASVRSQACDLTEEVIESSSRNLGDDSITSTDSNIYKDSITSTDSNIYKDSITSTDSNLYKDSNNTHTVCVPYYKAAPYNISHTKIFQWRFSL